MLRSLSLCLALVSVSAVSAGCATHEADAKPATATPKSGGTASDDHALCVKMFDRNRTCTDQYIPALVDARARKDMPAGIAAEVKSDRDGVIAQAKQEWAKDSTDEAIESTCNAIVAHLSDADRADETAISQCLEKSDCGEYVTCQTPVLEKHLQHP
jgi:hypothetical protein